MEKRKKELIEKLQEERIGKRFKGACMSSVSFEKEESLKISEWIERSSGILFMTGVPGTGKTYFCSALLGYIAAKYLDFVYFSEYQLLERVRGAIENGWSYRKEVVDVSNYEFLIIDDLGSSLNLTDWRCEVIGDLIDLRYSSQKPTVITTNHTYDELDEIFGKRTASRLWDDQNYVIDLQGCKDRRTLKNLQKITEAKTKKQNSNEELKKELKEEKALHLEIQHFRRKNQEQRRPRKEVKKHL